MCSRTCHPISDFALGWTRSSLYHTEWKSWIVAKSICTNWNSASAHAAWVKHLTQAAWAEAEFQFVQRYFAAILDFHSVWYRDDLVKPRVKLEQLYFGLTGPSMYYINWIECEMYLCIHIFEWIHIYNLIKDTIEYKCFYDDYGHIFHIIIGRLDILFDEI